MKVALVHDFLNQYGGAERVLEALHDLYPEAPVYTSLYDPNKLPLRMKNWDIRAFKLPRFPLAKTYTFFYPLLFENLDLSGYDLVISTSANFAKGVLTKPTTPHISYIHTPPRFLYHYPSEINRRKLWFLRPVLAPLDNLLRVWDFAAAQRPDYLLTNSKETVQRIKKFYNRQATVIYPPVDLKLANTSLGREDKTLSTDGYFLVVSRLAAYKRIDLAVQAANQRHLPLKIVGTGREERRLKRIAGPTVEFLGFVGDEKLGELYRNCKALIFPGMEDFGITPVEAMAHGKPVIALAQGGTLETVVEGKTGKFFAQETVESLVEALESFDPEDYKAKNCIAQARKFSKERFQKEFKTFVKKVLK